MSFRFSLGRVDVQFGFGVVEVLFSDDNDGNWNESLKLEIGRLLEIAETLKENRLVVVTVYNRWRRSVSRVGKFLVNAEDKISKHSRNTVVADAVGCSVSAAGSAVAVAGVAAALPTLGLSLGLTIGGTVCSGVGSAVAIGSSKIGNLLMKDLIEKATEEYNVFTTRSEKLNLRFKQYIQDLKKFFRLYTSTIIPRFVKIIMAEDPSLFEKYLSVGLTSVAPVDMMLALARKNEERQNETETLERIRHLIAEDTCLSAKHSQLSSTDFSEKREMESDDSKTWKVIKKLITGDPCFLENYNLFVTECPSSVEVNETPACTLLRGTLQSGRAAFRVGRFINVAGDAVEGIARGGQVNGIVKGAAFVGRPLLVVLGGVALGFDAAFMGYAFWNLYKMAPHERLEEVRNFLKLVKTLGRNVSVFLSPLELTEGQNRC